MVSSTKKLVESYIQQYVELKVPTLKITKNNFFICPFHHEHEEDNGKPTCKMFTKHGHVIKCFDPSHNKYWNIFELVRKFEPEMKEFSDDDIAEYLTHLLDIKSNEEIDKLLMMYHDAGFGLIALSPNSKNPVAGQSWLNNTSYEISQWREWINNGLGLGLRLGEASKVVAIDIDSQEALDKMRDLMGDTFMQMTKRGCYDEQTELLTENGWKFFKDLNKNEKVAQWDNGNISFVSPLTHFKYKYKGKMVQFKSKTLDLLVTPNHNMFTCSSTWNNTNFQFKKAIEYLDYSPITFHRIPGYFNWEGEYKQDFHLPIIEKKYKQTRNNHFNAIPMTDWVSFLGWYLSEGSCVYDEKLKMYRVTIWQKKPKNILKIYRVLKKLPFTFKYFHVKRGDGNINTGFNISGQQLAHYLKKFGLHDKKYIPREILNLSTFQLNILYQALMDGDGDKENCYYTTSKQLADDVQELIVKLGFRSSIKSRKRNSIHKRCYEVTRYTNKYAGFRKKNINLVEYNNYVYCVEVPSHLLIIRRNENITICGNSHYLYGYDADFDGINHQNFRTKGLEAELRANNAYIVVAPTLVDNFTRYWNYKKILPMPAELKKYILSLIDKTDKIDNDSEKMPDETLRGDLKGLDGRCNDTFIKMGGVLRKKLPLKQTEYALMTFNKLLAEPLPYKDIKGMMYQISRYNNYDQKELAEEVLNHLKLIQQSTARDLQSSLGFEKKNIEEVLSYLVEEGKIVKHKNLYKIIDKIEWEEDFMSIRNPILFKVPYFDNYANFDDGNMIILGAKSGAGKSHLACNFVKELVNQGLKPNLLCTEAGSKFGIILASLGIKVGDVKFKIISNPTSVELEDNAVTILDWLNCPDGDYSQMEVIYSRLNSQLVKHGGFLIVFAQLKQEDGNFYAESMTRFYASLVAKYNWSPIKNEKGVIVDWDARHTYFHTEKIRDSKTGKQYLDIPMEFNPQTKILSLRGK